MTLEGEEGPVPSLTVVSGSPSPEELAALTAVVVALSSGAAPADEPRRSVWTDRSRLTRPPLHAGPGAWRASGLPR